MAKRTARTTVGESACVAAMHGTDGNHSARKRKIRSGSVFSSPVPRPRSSDLREPRCDRLRLDRWAEPNTSHREFFPATRSTSESTIGEKC